MSLRLQTIKKLCDVILELFSGFHIHQMGFFLFYNEMKWLTLNFLNEIIIFYLLFENFLFILCFNML